MEYTVINIKNILENLGEEQTKKLLSNFLCKNNKEIEIFLHKNAIEFSKKKIAMTFLLIGEEGILGYFTLANKVIKISKYNLSKTL